MKLSSSGGGDGASRLSGRATSEGLIGHGQTTVTEVLKGWSWVVKRRLGSDDS